MSALRPRPSRSRFLWAIAVSSLLHLGLGYWALEWWQLEVEQEEFRVRLAYHRAKLQPRRLDTSAMESRFQPQSQMEYLSLESRLPGTADEVEPTGRKVPELEAQEAPLALRDFELGVKSELPVLEREHMVRPRDIRIPDSVSREDTDLLRWEDLARADAMRSGILADVDTPRDLAGYVNFTRLSLYGAGSDSAGSLDALARYIRDQTGILARVGSAKHRRFISTELLKDPIHFLVQDHGEQVYDETYLIKFSELETEMLGRYLTKGGFLFVEGGNRYLREMISLLHSVLGRDGRLHEIPPDHAIYHSYYDFEQGFPGENKRRNIVVGHDNWYYPTSSLRERYDQAGNQGGGGRPDPIGLYGVEYNGDLVAVISDLNLARRWVESRSPGPNPELPADVQEPAPITDNIGPLKSATNIVAFALSRPGGLTPAYQRPVWANVRPEWLPQAATQLTGYHFEELSGFEAPEILEDLDSYIAFVQSPLGAKMAGGDLMINIDGSYSLNLLKGDLHGVMLHNLPPGEHWVEMRYGGQTAQQEITLEGGSVLTITFSLNRLAFFNQLRLRQLQERVGIEAWWQSFGDLQLDEVFLDTDSEILDADEF